MHRAQKGGEPGGPRAQEWTRCEEVGTKGAACLRTVSLGDFGRRAGAQWRARADSTKRLAGNVWSSRCGPGQTKTAVGGRPGSLCAFPWRSQHGLLGPQEPGHSCTPAHPWLRHSGNSLSQQTPSQLKQAPCPKPGPNAFAACRLQAHSGPFQLLTLLRGLAGADVIT